MFATGTSAHVVVRQSQNPQERHVRWTRLVSARFGGGTLRRTRAVSAGASRRDNRYGAPGHSRSVGSCDEIPNSGFRIPNFAPKARGYNAPSGGNEVDLTTQFEASIEKGKSLPSQGNETLLELYGLYKQATVGDVAGRGAVGFRLSRRSEVRRVGEETGNDLRRGHAGLYRSHRSTCCGLSAWA